MSVSLQSCFVKAGGEESSCPFDRRQEREALSFPLSSFHFLVLTFLLQYNVALTFLCLQFFFFQSILP